jgi:hypothetical protein
MYYKVIYTNNNWLIPKKYAGVTRLFLVFIRPQYRNDVGLLQHELTHVRQFYKIPLIGAYLYRFSRKYRLHCELEAYREQLKHYQQDHSWLFAGYISKKYNLDISIEEAHRLLTQP